LGESVVAETSTLHFELSHEVDPIAVLLDLALGNDVAVANEVLKTQFFVHEADTDRLEAAYLNGSEV
jgi:aconitate hydratase 2/2-methylisocitrate dehydratase